jgi:8-oxo-dGTP pyrophosphatase MutT (NUDIX family)
MERVIPTHAVKAVITNTQGDILFLQRNAAGRADMKSNWDLPGGLVEEGEDDVTALEREVEEELRRKARVGQELGRWTFFRPFDGSTVEVTNYAVELDVSDIEALTLSNEHVAAKFVDRALLPELEVKDPSLFRALGE